ncbi:MAG: glycoside hydrolase family 88 protein [Clostridiales bacterium]|jgi:unsaturated rhamnogalacturonyl hydrolase|nr:glycoside hydrolase family 88 protein [Clostridiales bacterium]
MNDTLKKYNSLIRQHVDNLIVASTPSNPAWNVEHSLAMSDVNRQTKSSKTAKWNYIDSCMITALMSLYEATKELHILNFCDNFVSYYIDNDGEILGYDMKDFNIDDINGGRNLIKLYQYTKKTKYKHAADILYIHLTQQPRTKEGSFFHKGIYPNQIWLDGLYMGQVFYSIYEKLYNNCKNFDDIFHQFAVCHSKMFDKNAKLYYHGYDSTKEIFWADKCTGLSKSFWLRSNGWLLCALVDCLEIFVSSVPKLKYSQLIEQLNQLLDGMMQYQDQGMFYQVVDKVRQEGNYLETSGTAMVAYACLKAHRLGFRSNGYCEGQKIFAAICEHYLKVVENKLSLGGIVLVSGLGPKDNNRRDGSYEYYVSEPVVKDDAKGVMPFLLAYVELLLYNSFDKTV